MKLDIKLPKQKLRGFYSKSGYCSECGAYTGGGVCGRCMWTISTR